MANKKSKKKAKSAPGLNLNQKRFVELYDGNGTRAAELAGYKGDDKTLAVTAYRLIRNDKVRDAIRQREQKKLKAGVLSREERQAFWSNIVLDPRRGIESRMRASELLGKSEADFVEKKIIEGTFKLEDLVDGA